MGEPQETTIQYVPCRWCRGGGPLDIGSGAFRDFDSDLSYGIPVCGGCGGVGRRIDTSEFKGRAERIKNLRSAYCPIDPDPCGPLPPFMLLARLETLIAAVREMHRDHGSPDEESLASVVATGGLSKVLERHRADMERQATAFREAAKVAPDRADCLEALAQAVEGKLDDAEERLMALVHRDPTSSILWHNCGVFFRNYRRDAQRALEFLLRSTELQPQKALHYFQTAKLLQGLGQSQRAIDFMLRTRTCPDFETLPEPVKQAVREQANVS